MSKEGERLKKIVDFVKQRKYCLILLYWPFHSLWYEILRIAYPSDESVLIVESALDRKIPFCEWFLIPYVIWYFCIAYVLIYPLFKDKREFWRANLLIDLCMILPMIFCTVVPNGIDTALRPDFATLGRENILTWGVQLIYAADSPPRNCMPSMHVSVAWAMFFAILQSKIMLKKPIYKALFGVFALLVSLATVFIKQHSILDVFVGFGVAVLVFIAVYIGEKVYDKKVYDNKKSTD